MEQHSISSSGQQQPQGRRISLTMRRIGLDDLPEIPSLPEGYQLRAYEEGDAPSLVFTLRSAFDNNDWTPEKVYKELTGNPNVKAIFVIVSGGQVVATASALFEPRDSGRLAVLHWVGVDKGHRGKMLGYMVSLRVLYYFREQGYREVFLRTDDSRIPAIKTYLKLGFVPDYTDPACAEHWGRILSQLGPAYQHPFSSAGGAAAMSNSTGPSIENS